MRENPLCLCPGPLALALPPPSLAPCPRPSTPPLTVFQGSLALTSLCTLSQLVSVPVAAVDRILVSPQFTR